MNLEYQREIQDNQPLGRTVSAGSKLFSTLLFLFFFAAGSIFGFLLAREIVRNVQSHTWPAVSCTILESEVRQGSSDKEPYIFAVKYQYVYQNKTCQSEQYQLQKTSFRDYSKAHKLVEAYPAGSQTVCFVNPRNPNEAILKHSSPWLLCFLILPAIFILVGAGGIYATWFSKSRNVPGASEAVQTTDGKQLGKRGRIVLGLIFVAVGLGFSYMLLVRPLVLSLQARSWLETPCKIISGRVQRHESTDSHHNRTTTYRVDILYEYVIDGKSYRSNRYDFIGSSSSGYSGKRSIVDSYLRMKNPVCYVDPKNPSSAVLVRDVTWGNAIGLVSLVFIAAGVLLIVGTLRGTIK